MVAKTITRKKKSENSERRNIIFVEEKWYSGRARA